MRDSASREPPDPPELVVRALAAGGPCLVALSGGVDSAVVAWLAYRAVGDRAVALTLRGTAVAPEELQSAEAVARSIGISHSTVAADPLADARYVANGADRCYYCRTVEGRALRRWGEAHGVRQYLDGIHRDDLGDDRPGIRAMDEAGFRHPLLEARWTKAEVRRVAQSAGLPNWDRPSNACLASRVAHGEPITAETLARVASAERWLLTREFRRVRVRVRAGRARVEVGADEVPRLLGPELREAMERAFEAIGFSEVEIDPGGYRRGPPA